MPTSDGKKKFNGKKPISNFRKKEKVRAKDEKRIRGQAN